VDLARILAQVEAELRSSGIAHALIGGLALAAHGAARATTDLDLLVDGERAADWDAIMARMGYRALHRSAELGNYVSDPPERGRIDVLFARRSYTRKMLERAAPRAIAGLPDLPIADAADLIGLKVQAYVNDPRRRRADLVDIERLLRANPDLALERVREYFRLFEREADLEELLRSG
jgi:hypothetical protein